MLRAGYVVDDAHAVGKNRPTHRKFRATMIMRKYYNIVWRSGLSHSSHTLAARLLGSLRCFEVSVPAEYHIGLPSSV